MERAADILVVDDDAAVRGLLESFLTGVGYTVSTASCGEEALGMLRETSFDAALVDLVMPGMDGIELLKQARQIDPNICVIMVTGHASVETAVEAMREGAYEYVTKPFFLEEMKAAVARAVERSFLKKEAEQKEAYRHLSITDGLTALYNHRHFHEALQRELARAERYDAHVSLLMIDVDDFKAYNDRNGHQEGDRALRDVARLLSAAARKVDLVARYGGEEFAIILPDTDREGAWTVAGNIRTLVEETIFEHEAALPSGKLTVSIGVATCPEDARKGEELIRKADEALYEAKRRGKNRACVLEAWRRGGVEA